MMVIFDSYLEILKKIDGLIKSYIEELLKIIIFPYFCANKMNTITSSYIVLNFW